MLNIFSAFAYKIEFNLELWPVGIRRMEEYIKFMGMFMNDEYFIY